MRRFSILLVCLLPSLAWGDAQADLQAAQNAAQAHLQSAAAARADARSDAARAALLAEQQVQAALKLRKLEDQTGAASMALAELEGRAAVATATLRDNEAALARLLPIMQRLSEAPAATILATPESPADSVRGILVLQGLAAGIESRAEAVRRDSQAAATLLGMMTTEQKILIGAVAAQQIAEAALSAQIATARGTETLDRDEAARQAAAALAADAGIRNLQDMISRLNGDATPAPAGLPVPADNGSPVAGQMTQAFGDATVAGPAEGVIYRAAPGARVVSPCAGPVLFADRFQSYGLLVILDCGGGYNFVLSGMNHLDVAAGQRLAHGQPLGEMLGYQAHDPARAPSLYLELRQNGTPVDPSGWLRNGGSG